MGNIGITRRLIVSRAGENGHVSPSLKRMPTAEGLAVQRKVTVDLIAEILRLSKTAFHGETIKVIDCSLSARVTANKKVLLRLIDLLSLQFHDLECEDIEPWKKKRKPRNGKEEDASAT